MKTAAQKRQKSSLAEVIEDVALPSAIREGEKSKRVKRELVMRALVGRK